MLHRSRALVRHIFGRLFWRLWVGQIALVSLAWIGSGAGGMRWIVVVLALGCLSAMVSAQVSLPLRQLLRKARGGSREEAREDIELGDLESELDRMRAKLEVRGQELAREREELSTVMSAISDAILAIDRDGNALFFNSRFALLFGGREISGRRARLGELFRAPEVLDAFQRSLRQGEAARAELALRVIGEASPKDFSLSISPLRRETGEAYGAVGVFHEVTELKRAERIRIDFVANVSHELRTPLTAIKGYADTLQEDVVRGDLRSAGQCLDALNRNVDRLMALIGDLLDLSSLEAPSGGEAGLARQKLDPRMVTERALSQVERARSAKNISIQTTFRTEEVMADVRRLEQVIVNLLENAVKYVPTGGQVLVEWSREAAEAVLRVRDDGPGIPAEHLPRLFERFYRVEQARSRDAGGTGLGLAIVKHIVQQHGGTVGVASEPGRGTEFICRFPG